MAPLSFQSIYNDLTLRDTPLILTTAVDGAAGFLLGKVMCINPNHQPNTPTALAISFIFSMRLGKLAEKRAGRIFTPLTAHTVSRITATVTAGLTFALFTLTDPYTSQAVLAGTLAAAVSADCIFR